MNINDQIHVTIESMANGGYGLSKVEGSVIFVPHTAPGDQVWVRLTDVKKNVCFGVVERIEEASDVRIEPPCSYFTRCGGCDWLHLPYETQRETKQSLFEDALKRYGRFEVVPDIQMHTESSKQYRSRALLRGQIKNKKLSIGFFEAQSHKQIPVASCYNLSSTINEWLGSISGSTCEAVDQKFRIEVQEIQKQVPKLILTFHPLVGKRFYKPLLDLLKRSKDVVWAGLPSQQDQSPYFLWDEDEGYKFWTKPGSFLQVNRELNRQVRQKVSSFVDEIKPKTVLDLFCGSGNLTLPLSDSSRSVTGVESAKRSIEIANHNKKSNRLGHVNFVQKASHVFLKHFEGPVDLVVVDPPRKGMKECLPELLRLKPKYLLYMSCQMMTFMRDASELRESYDLIHVDLYDFFPNTYHVESLALFKRK